MLDEPPPDPGQERATSGPGAAGESAPGTRQARRLRARRRNFLLVLVGVAAALALAVLVGALMRGGSDDASTSAAPADASGAAAKPETLLLGHRGADGRIDLLVLVGAGHDQASVLLFPVATQVEVPSLGPQALADLPDEGGLLATTIENLVGVKVARTVVVDDAGLNAALAAAAPMNVDLNREVKFADSAEGILPAGSTRRSAAQATRLLVAAQEGSELDRLVTVQDVLDAWMGRLRNPAVARATLKAQPGLAALVTAAKASEQRTDTLPVESVATGGAERFEPRVADVNRYAELAFPDAQLAVGGSRPRVEILNGTGAVGLAQTIAARIVPAGGQVTLTGNVPNFGLPNTQVVYYRRADRAAAQRLRKALGCGALKQADTPIGVVDVTILAGADCFRTGETPTP